jgi:hypothetical protein
MANQSTILFDPELDERALDKEVDNVNQQLEGVGEDVPVNFEGEMPEMDGLMPAGAGGGGGGVGPGGAAGAGALASKIPKSVAGVTAAAALPVALAGGVGVGLLSAMQSASARLQTSSSLLGIAVDNFFREPGNILDEFIVRPIVNEILNASLAFDEALRDLSSIGDGMLPANLDEFERRADAAIDVLKLMPGPVGAITSAADDAADVLGDVASLWPGWPDVSGLWPGWPDVGDLWPGWPDIDTEWPGWPDVGTPTWPSSSDILSLFPSISAGNLRDRILGRFDPTSDGGDTGGNDTTGGRDWQAMLPEDIPDQLTEGFASGGRVRSTGIATVHRNEIIASPDRLVSELASAVSQASGGGRTNVSMDTREMERKLDQLNRNVRRLADSLSVDGVGAEEIARLSTNGRQERISDRDPTV